MTLVQPFDRSVTELSIAVSRKARPRLRQCCRLGEAAGQSCDRSGATACDSPPTIAGRANGSRAPGNVSNASVSTAARAGSSATASVTNRVIADAERGTDQHRVDIKHPVGEAHRLPSGSSLTLATRAEVSSGWKADLRARFRLALSDYFGKAGTAMRGS